jgi:hypothetical protein
LPEDTLDAWAKGYYFRTKADSNKKPPSDVVFAALNPPHYEFNPDHNELAHTATGNTYPIFAVAVKGDTKTVVPAQGTLLEYREGDKWKKGLPKGDITAPLEIRIPGGATYLPSESVWIKFNSALGTLNWGYSETDGNFAENEVSDLLADEAKWSENADISDPDVYIQGSGELVFEAYFYEGYPLLGVSLDGIDLEKGDYTAEQGSITISAEAMAKVPVGTSIAVFTFSDGIYKGVVHVMTQNQYDVDLALGLIAEARYAGGGYNGTIELPSETPPASLEEKYEAIEKWLNGLSHTGGGKIPAMSELGVNFKIAAIDYNKYRITVSKGSGDSAASYATSMSFLFTT